MSQHDTQRQTGGRTRERVRPHKPLKYDVIFHNDDVTTMEFVIDVLTRVFARPYDEALSLTLKVHFEGKSVVATYTYDIAASKTAKATAMARGAGFPLRITCEPSIDDLPF